MCACQYIAHCLRDKCAKVDISIKDLPNISVVPKVIIRPCQIDFL